MVWGGEDGCGHEWGSELIRKEMVWNSGTGNKGNAFADKDDRDSKRTFRENSQGQFCRLCGAWRGSYGLEPTIELYVEHTVQIFREVRRVLRNDGTLFLNLGDSFASGGNSGQGEYKSKSGLNHGKGVTPGQSGNEMQRRCPISSGLKSKDLCGIPWTVAKALQQPYYIGKIKQERDRVWLAAMIDGEGSICGFTHKRTTGRTEIDGYRTGVHIQITNSNQALLDEAFRIYPSASKTLHMNNSVGHFGSKQCYRWHVFSAEGRKSILTELYPYLIAKKKQALLAYNLVIYQEMSKTLGRGSQTQDIRDKRKWIVESLSRLNKDEPIDIPSWIKEPPSLYEPGWYLRSDCIWAKKNCMPESCTDRPTKSHEYIFLLTKSATYFWDQEAVRQEATKTGTPGHLKSGNGIRHNNHLALAGQSWEQSAGRNLRTVWEMATAPFPEAHFATFPPSLPERCIKAGTSEKGCCPKCGASWKRVVEKERQREGATPHIKDVRLAGNTAMASLPTSQRTDASRSGMGTPIIKTIDWRPTCKCKEGYWEKEHGCFRENQPYKPIPCTVLDPFSGAGTTALVAAKLGRDAIGIELNLEYVEMSRKRLTKELGMLAEIEVVKL